MNRSKAQEYFENGLSYNEVYEQGRKDERKTVIEIMDSADDVYNAMAMLHQYFLSSSIKETDEDMALVKESFIEDIVIEKFDSLATQIAKLSKQLEELDEFTEEYVKIEKQRMNESTTILPVLNEEEKELLLSAMDFLSEYKNLYGCLPDVESVFNASDREEINGRLSYLDIEYLDRV